MTERNGMRYGVLGLIVLTLLIFLGLMVAMRHGVYATLGEKMGGEIHALQLRTLTPEEAA